MLEKWLAVRNPHPSIVAGYNKSRKQSRTEYLSREQLKQRLVELLIPTCGEIGWQVAKSLTDQYGWGKDKYLGALALATGSATALGCIPPMLAIKYHEFKKHSAASASEAPHTFKTALYNDRKDIYRTIITSLICDSLWIVYYFILVQPLARLIAGLDDDEHPPFHAEAVAMIPIFGMLTTLTNDFISKTLGTLLSDSGSAHIEDSIITGVGAALMLGVVGELEDQIDHLDPALYITLLLALAGIVTFTGTASTTLITTGLTSAYHKAANYHKIDIENEASPLLNSADVTVIPSLIEELQYRYFNKRRGKMASGTNS